MIIVLNKDSTMKSDCSHLIPDVIKISQSAGQLILNYYQSNDYEKHTKKDDTPVTSADLASHEFITEQLKKLTPDIPVLSEEDADISLSIRSKWSRYWLVDPLDGTQEFIAQSGDFATIIALIENNHPIMGVIYSPVSETVYYAYKGMGAWKIPKASDPIPLSTHRHELSNNAISIAISRRQNTNSITNRLNTNWNYDLIPLGSAALKACLVAEGAVDCYLRIGPTGEWDTAATQCIVEESGGAIMSTKLVPLSYNRRTILENPNFIVVGDPNLPWKDILKTKN